MILFIFIPLIIGSIIGLAFVLMLLARVWVMPVEKPELLNRVAQTLASGNREKALLLLEEDNHPISNVLSFALKLSVDEAKELRDAFEYASQEMTKRLSFGTQTLSWLTITVPVATVMMWFIVAEKPSQHLTYFIGIAIISEIVFWNVTLLYVKLKTRLIMERANDHFAFLSGMMSLFDSKKTDISGLVDQITDTVEISAGRTERKS